MENYLTQEIIGKAGAFLISLHDITDEQVEHLNKLINAILSQVDTMIEARMQAHIIASHTALADSNKE